MTKQKSSSKQLIEIALIALIILCVGLIVVEMGSNLSAEIVSHDRETTNGQELLPTPYPTLTTEELQESLSQPVEN